MNGDKTIKKEENREIIFTKGDKDLCHCFFIDFNSGRTLAFDLVFGQKKHAGSSFSYFQLFSSRNDDLGIELGNPYSSHHPLQG